MPWPMVHFAISYELYNQKPHPAFLLGSVAPDAVWVREKDEFKAAYGKSQLNGLNLKDWQGLTDFYNSTIKDAGSVECQLFLLGYASHIMADCLWGRIKRDICGSDQNLRDLLWKEEEQYDLNLYRTKPWGAKVELELIASPLYEIHDLYLLEELDKWRHEIFNNIRQSDHRDPSISIQHITEDAVEVFVNRTVSEFSNWSESVSLGTK